MKTSTLSKDVQRNGHREEEIALGVLEKHPHVPLPGG